MSTNYVRIHAGSYRNEEVKDKVVPVVKDFRQGKKGTFLTVDGTKLFGVDRDQIRILCRPEDVSPATEEEYQEQPAGAGPTIENLSERKPRTDEEIMADLEERFDVMHELAAAAPTGQIRSLIVSGPAGVGKSYGVIEELDKYYGYSDGVGEDMDHYTQIKGRISAFGLFMKLYNYRREGQVVVFDDSDDLLRDELSLNLLKSALDSSKRRVISWETDSRTLEEEGIPNRFEFNGTAIFISNIRSDLIRSEKLQEHLKALESRSLYLDLGMETMHERILRIKQVHRKGDLFSNHSLTKEEGDEVIEFMYENQDRLREMSLRMAVKLADLRETSPNGWQRLARNTCMVR